MADGFFAGDAAEAADDVMAGDAGGFVDDDEAVHGNTLAVRGSLPLAVTRSNSMFAVWQSPDIVLEPNAMCV